MRQTGSYIAMHVPVIHCFEVYVRAWMNPWLWNDDENLGNKGSGVGLGGFYFLYARNWYGRLVNTFYPFIENAGEKSAPFFRNRSCYCPRRKLEYHAHRYPQLKPGF
jgi:hypothetical protein